MVSEAYLILNRRGISRLSKRQPQLRAGEVIVKLKITLGPRFLEQFVPTASFSLNEIQIQSPQIAIEQMSTEELQALVRG